MGKHHERTPVTYTPQSLVPVREPVKVESPKDNEPLPPPKSPEPIPPKVEEVSSTAGKKRVWVVQEERRAGLTGALVTLPKGKIIYKEQYAKHLLAQNVPLEEQYI